MIAKSPAKSLEDWFMEMGGFMVEVKESTLFQEVQREMAELYRFGDPHAAERARTWNLLADQVVGHETCFSV